MHDFPGANGCLVAFFPPPAARAGVLEPLQKFEWSRFEHTSSLAFFNPGAPPIFFNGSNACAYQRAQKNATTHNGGELFTPGKLCIDFHSHTECMEEDHEYANELGKQGGTFRQKYSINHKRFSRTIEKIMPTHSS